MVEERYFQNNYYDNLGMVYASGTGTFTIRGSNARSLSPSNPAVIFLPSKATPGAMTKYTITADQNFIDDNGSSQIIGNLFGLTTSVATTVNIPFYLYAVTNDDEDTIQFMISREPGRKISPTSGNIGAPDDAVANTQSDFWSLDNIDETLYDSNPCMMVGSFRMNMSASDDWTVVSLSNLVDGIGLFQEGVLFGMPAGQFGADSGSFTVPNGGTSASFTTNNAQYSITKDGYCSYNVLLNSDAGTDGAGGVVAKIACPFIFSSTTTEYYGSGRIIYAATESLLIVRGVASGNTSQMYVEGSSNLPLNWSAFSNGNRKINFSIHYSIF